MDNNDGWIMPMLNGMFAKQRISGFLPEAMRLLVEVGQQAQANQGVITPELYNEIGAFCTEVAHTFEQYAECREDAEKATEGTDTNVSF
jgi:hypothetical protein